jgi:hypothetical protein
MAERSGEIVSIKELHLDQDVISKYVRVTGHVKFVNLDISMVQIEHENAVLYVCTSMVPASSLKLDSLAQFIGEVRPAREHDYLKDNTGPQDFYLKAKVFRLVDGLDMKLYVQSVEARREYLSAGARTCINKNNAMDTSC